MRGIHDDRMKWLKLIARRGRRDANDAGGVAMTNRRNCLLLMLGDDRNRSSRCRNRCGHWSCLLLYRWNMVLNLLLLLLQLRLSWSHQLRADDLRVRHIIEHRTRRVVFVFVVVAVCGGVASTDRHKHILTISSQHRRLIRNQRRRAMPRGRRESRRCRARTAQRH